MTNSFDKVEKFSSSAEALNKKGFAEFLARYSDIPDNVDDLDAEKVEQRFEVFQKVDIVGRELTKVFEQSVKKDLGIEIKIEDGKAESINKYLEDKIFNDVEEYERITAIVERFSTLREKSLAGEAEKNKQIEKFGGEDKLNEYLNNTSLKEKLQRQYLRAKNWFTGENEKIDKDNLRDKLETVDSTKFGFEASKAMLLNELMVIGDLKKELVDGAQRKLEDLLDTATTQTTIKSFEEAEKYFEKMKSVGGSIDQNLLEGMNEKEIQKGIDEGLENAVTGKIKDTLKNHSLGSNTFDKLEKSLSEFTDRSKLGSKENEEVRDFIVKTLEDTLKLAPAEVDADPTKAKAKKILVKTLLVKLQS
ncbi:MAG: hypothetical protein Q7R78_01535 [bacterium]|nr:hypothetical protein [bacterium]